MPEIINSYFRNVDLEIFFPLFIGILLFIIYFISKNFFLKIVIKKNKFFITNYLELSLETAVNKFNIQIKIAYLTIFLLFYNYVFLSNSFLFAIMNKISLSLFVIFIFLFISTIIKYSRILALLDKNFSEALSIWIKNGLQYIVILVGIASVLELWGVKVAPIIAGLGLLGVAIALGAQDLFKNLISGIILIVENKFKINDVIEIPGYGEGTLEKIGFRSTIVRSFDSSPMYIPNNIIVDQAISNFSKRHFRRIYWNIGLEYATNLNTLKNIRDSIEKFIISNNDLFIVNNDYQCNVRINKFNDSSIDILIICFVNSNIWKEYLEIKEKLILRIKDIVENENNSNFAFPSRTLYMKNIDNIDRN